MTKQEIAMAVLVKNYRHHLSVLSDAAPLSEERALALASVEAYENSISIFDTMIGGTGRGIVERIEVLAGTTDEAVAVDFVAGRIP